MLCETGQAVVMCGVFSSLFWLYNQFKYRLALIDQIKIVCTLHRHTQPTLEIANGNGEMTYSFFERTAREEKVNDTHDISI